MRPARLIPAVTVAAVLGLAGCSAGDGGWDGSGTAAGFDRSAGAIGDDQIVDVCVWLALEVPVGTSFIASVADARGTWDDHYQGYSYEQLALFEQPAAVTYGPGDRVSVACPLRYSGMSGDVLTVELVSGADAASTVGSDARAWEYLGYEFAHDYDTNTTFVVLGDDELLRLHLGMGGAEQHSADVNNETVLQLAARMTDAWHAGRVPALSTRSSPHSIDPSHICGPVATRVAPFIADTLESPTDPYVIVAELQDWPDAPKYTCTARPEADMLAPAATLEIALHWAPSEEDARIDGAGASEGCAVGDNVGVMLACQPGWLYYTTVQGRWLVTLQQRDRSIPASMVNDEVVSEDEQRVFEALAASVAEAVADLTPGEDERPPDPRVTMPFSSDATPFGLACTDGAATAGYRTERAALVVCVDQRTNRVQLVGEFDGEAFDSDAVTWDGLHGAADVARGTDDEFSIHFTELTVEAYQNGAPLLREYLDERWIAADRVG